jgi:hypothetical protein
MLILQLHPDFAPELVVLCEHCYHRHLKNPACQSQLNKLCLDAPFLSGQISSKYFRSSDGRTLSIGTQYLKGKPLGIGNRRCRKVQTISRAIYRAMTSLVTYDGQNLAQSPALVYLRPRIHASRGKRIRHDLKT